MRPSPAGRPGRARFGSGCAGAALALVVAAAACGHASPEVAAPRRIVLDPAQPSADVVVTLPSAGLAVERPRLVGPDWDAFELSERIRDEHAVVFRVAADPRALRQGPRRDESFHAGPPYVGGGRARWATAQAELAFELGDVTHRVGVRFAPGPPSRLAGLLAGALAALLTVLGVAAAAALAEPRTRRELVELALDRWARASPLERGLLVAAVFGTSWLGPLCLERSAGLSVEACGRGYGGGGPLLLWGGALWLALAWTTSTRRPLADPGTYASWALVACSDRSLAGPREPGWLGRLGAEPLAPTTWLDPRPWALLACLAAAAWIPGRPSAEQRASPQGEPGRTVALAWLVGCGLAFALGLADRQPFGPPSLGAGAVRFASLVGATAALVWAGQRWGRSSAAWAWIAAAGAGAAWLARG